MFLHWALSWFLGVAADYLLKKGEEFLEEYTADKRDDIVDWLHSVLPFQAFDQWLERQLEAAIPYLFMEIRSLVKAQAASVDAVHQALSNVKAKVQSHPSFTSQAKDTHEDVPSDYLHSNHRV